MCEEQNFDDFLAFDPIVIEPTQEKITCSLDEFLKQFAESHDGYLKYQSFRKLQNYLSVENDKYGPVERCLATTIISRFVQVNKEYKHHMRLDCVRMFDDIMSSTKMVYSKISCTFIVAYSINRVLTAYLHNNKDVYSAFMTQFKATFDIYKFTAAHYDLFDSVIALYNIPVTNPKDSNYLLECVLAFYDLKRVCLQDIFRIGIVHFCIETVHGFLPHILIDKDVSSITATMIKIVGFDTKSKFLIELFDMIKGNIKVDTSEEFARDLRHCLAVFFCAEAKVIFPHVASTYLEICENIFSQKKADYCKRCNLPLVTEARRCYYNCKK